MPANLSDKASIAIVVAALLAFASLAAYSPPIGILIAASANITHSSVLAVIIFAPHLWKQLIGGHDPFDLPNENATAPKSR